MPMPLDSEVIDGTMDVGPKKKPKTPSDWDKEAVFNPAGYELETLSVLVRQASLSFISSMETPSHLYAAAEALYTCFSNVHAVMPDNIARPFNEALKKLKRDIRDYLRTNADADRLDILEDAKYNELRDRLEKALYTFNTYRYAAGLGIPIRRNKPDAEKIRELM